MYRKYFVYLCLDDGKNTYRVAIPAENEDKARDYCAGNGEVIAIKDVTEDYPIDVSKVRNALDNAGFGESEIDWICRTLQEFKIVE